MTLTPGAAPPAAVARFDLVVVRPDDTAGRRRTPDAVEAIADVTVPAFATLEISNQTEHSIAEVLRTAGALAISLVAELEGLSRVRPRNARRCCLVGHPAYDKRFDFGNTPVLVDEGVPPQAFHAMVFDGRIYRGTVAFREAFLMDGQAH